MKLFRQKADGVVDAAHFNSDGSLAWVRAYERRGPTWSDRVLLDRPALIRRLAAGKRFYTGKRVEYRASEFELEEPIRLIKQGRQSFLVAGKGRAERDQLQNLPIV